MNGHMNVLHWAIENGASLDLASFAKVVLQLVCLNGHTIVLEWFLTAHPSVLESVEVSDFITQPPTNCHVLDILASHLDTSKITQVLRSLASRENCFFVPSVIEWCKKQVMQFDADFFHRMMRNAASSGNAQDMDQFLLLGGTWRAEYFRYALEHNRVTFCQWAHKRGDLDLDLTRVDKSNVYSMETLMFLASVGVYISVSDEYIFRRLAIQQNDSLVYIINHYPRYVT